MRHEIIISYLHRQGGMIILCEMTKEDLWNTLKEGGTLTNATTAFDNQRVPATPLNEEIHIPVQLKDNCIIEVFEIEAKPMKTPEPPTVEFTQPFTTA